jgi:hypothetical protein
MLKDARKVSDLPYNYLETSVKIPRAFKAGNSTTE